MEYCVKLVSFSGMEVLDLFAGSGSTGVACRNLDRRFVGVKLDPGYYEIMEKRLSDMEGL